MDSVWDMVERADDVQVRFQSLHMVEQCPLGRLVDELADGPLESDRPGGVSVTKDGSYRVTVRDRGHALGRWDVEDAQRGDPLSLWTVLEQPLCDSAHKNVGFRDG